MAKQGKNESYADELRQIRSLFVVSSLKRKADLAALECIKYYKETLNWRPFSAIMIDKDVWDYIVNKKQYDPKLVFCHPNVICNQPTTSIYYRGLCALSLKEVKRYFTSVQSVESGNRKRPLEYAEALPLARLYNTFVCSIIKNSTDWTLENGYRTIIATLGISLDGAIRNKIGIVAEQRIHAMIILWLIDNGLVVKPSFSRDDIENGQTFQRIELKGGVLMEFSSEPDISFKKTDDLLAVVEIKGGTDAAGALERYGAATKSFQNSMSSNPRCKNFYLVGVRTKELDRRIEKDRFVEKTYNIVEMLQQPSVRDDFFMELFHHVLRLF